MDEYVRDDIYCDLIIPRKVEVDIVQDTNNILAFHHTKPFWPVHIVVVPKSHIASLLELEDVLALELLSVLKNVAWDVQNEHGSAQIVTHLGEYQDSKHLHVHVASGQRLRS